MLHTILHTLRTGHMVIITFVRFFIDRLKNEKYKCISKITNTSSLIIHSYNEKKSELKSLNKEVTK